MEAKNIPSGEVGSVVKIMVMGAVLMTLIIRLPEIITALKGAF